jgi:predicted TIM-barrel fold metal-dependent hydrolase
MLVIDNHVHLGRVGEHVSQWVMSELRKPWIDRHFRYNVETGPTKERREPEDLVELMDEAGIDACCVMAGMWERVLKPEQRPHNIPNELVAETLAAAPTRFVGIASADPIADPYAAADEVARWLKNDFRAVKLYPTYAQFDPRDERCFPIYEVAQAHDVPVHFHMGWSPVCSAQIEFQRPMLLDEVGVKFPKLKVVICHMGWPYWEETIGIVARHPNFHADLSALGFWGSEKLYGIIHDFGCMNSYDRLLYGSENPFMAQFHKTVMSINDVARRLDSSVIPDRELEKVMGVNAVRLYKLDAKKIGRAAARPAAQQGRP